MNPTISVTIQRDRLPTHTDEQFREWAMWASGCGASISCDNPLSECELLDYTNPMSFRIENA